MSIVVPGQYLHPEYKTEGRDAGEHIVQYIPGKGAAVSSIRTGASVVPVIVATVLGKQLVQQIHEQEEKERKVTKYLVSVLSGSQNEYEKYSNTIDASASQTVSATATNLPREGDEVLVRITRLNPKQAFCEILCVYGFGNVAPDGGLGSNGSSAHLSIPMGGGLQILSSYAAVASSQSILAGAQPLDLGENFKGVIRTQDVRSTDRDKVKIIDCFRPGDLVKAVVLSLGDGQNYYLTTARNDLGVVFARSEGGAGGQMMALDWETMVCEKTGVQERRKCAKLFK